MFFDLKMTVSNPVHGGGVGKIYTLCIYPTPPPRAGWELKSVFKQSIEVGSKELGLQIFWTRKIK